MKPNIQDRCTVSLFDNCRATCTFLRSIWNRPFLKVQECIHVKFKLLVSVLLLWQEQLIVLWEEVESSPVAAFLSFGLMSFVVEWGPKWEKEEEESKRCLLVRDQGRLGCKQVRYDDCNACVYFHFKVRKYKSKKKEMYNIMCCKEDTTNTHNYNLYKWKSH